MAENFSTVFDWLLNFDEYRPIHMIGRKNKKSEKRQ